MGKNFLMASVAVAALASRLALAADMPVKAAVKASPPIYNWTGFYVGANAGVSAGVTPILQTSAIPPFHRASQTGRLTIRSAR